MAQRSSPRHACNIDALACTPIESRPARIVDLSRGGAKLQLEAPFESGRRIHIDLEGNFYWATVMWSEVDRMGVRFHSPVTAGVLDDRLKQLQVLQARSFQPAPRIGGFGRRIAM